MFGRLTDIPPFADRQADGIFGNINGQSFDDDNTMVATLRSLLYNRIEKDSSFNFLYTKLDSHRYEDKSCEKIISEYLNVNESNEIYFTGFFGNESKTENDIFKKFDDPESGITAKYGYTELKDIKLYFRDRFEINTRVYIKPDINSCWIFCDLAKCSVRFFHNFVACIPRFIPKLFEGDKQLTEDEINVLRCLAEKEETAENYLRYMDILGDKLGLREIIIENLINGFAKKIKANQLRTAENEFNSIERQINDFFDEYNRLIDQREEKLIRMEGIRALMNKASDDSELIEYLRLHKNINVIGTDESKIFIIIKTLMTNFDYNAYEMGVKSGGAYDGFSVHEEVFKDLANRKLLMDAIFSENPKLKIKMCGYYVLDINGRVESQSQYEYGPKYEDCLPNPHLNFHSCIGNNRGFISEQLRNGETINAIECCVASCASLNYHETAQTYRPFLEILFTKKSRFLVNNEGKEMNTVEALAWLKGEE